MTEFNSSRFVDIGQQLYVGWLTEKEAGISLSSLTEYERKEVLAYTATMAFEAAEEFAEVFKHKEDS